MAQRNAYAIKQQHIRIRKYRLWH